MPGLPLPVNIDTSYADSSTGDLTVQLHQQHHDTIHTIVNRQPVNVMVYGAVADSNGTVGNGTNNSAAFTAAFGAAAAQGLGVYVPPGKYRLSTALTLAKGQTLVGAGAGGPDDITTAATALVFDNGVNGVILAGKSSQLVGVSLVGGSGAVNGVTVQNAITRCVDVAIRGFGQDGYNCDSTTGNNCDVGFCQNVKVYGCGRDGFHLIGSDSNAGYFVGCNLVSNGNAGISVGAGSSRNSFIGIWMDSNGTDGIVDGGTSNVYDAYVEGGSGSTLRLLSGSVWGIFRGTLYAMPQVVGDTTAQLSWQISNGLVQRGRILIGDASDSGSGIQWSLENGAIAPGWLGVRDANSATYLLRAILSAATVYWYVHQLPNATGTYDIGSSSLKWRDLYLSGMLHMPTYTTAGRPAAATAGVGAAYYDTTVSKPVWSTGAAWHDASGAVV